MTDFFAPPAFKPAEALVQLKRQLREGKGLAERGDGFDLKGQAVIHLEATATTIEAQLAKRPARSPEWTKHSLKNSADVRKFVDTVKAQLTRWSADE
ncbi:hypothetical protein [Ideonella sp. BN130291]|uniref:hypothetical protein n=1 Tax=Ideonella sp. BN130291 TaxID=3112940 RepID=UPI002E26B663|nr:hypothetical protein [Ideonella sp. BN130291]